MSSGSLEVTLVSASISPYIPLENEPSDTYAILRCTKDQHCTKNARDQGRLPVWNETFIFDLQEQDMSSELLIQVFNIRTEVDELLGLARIPIYTMVGREEATLCALVSPTQREIGKLKAAWKWKPNSQGSLKASSFQKKPSEVEDYTKRESYNAEPFNPDLPYKSLKATNYEGKESWTQGYAQGESCTAGAAAAYDSKVPHYGSDAGIAAYPHLLNPNNMSSERFSKLDAVSDAMAKLAVDKEGSRRSQGGDYYCEPSAPTYGAYPTEPQGHTGFPDIRASEERKGDFGAYSSSAVHARGFSDHSYPPPPTNVFPSNKAEYPPHAGTTYPPPSDAFPPKKDTYHSGAAYPPPPTDTSPQDKDRYPSYPGSQYPQASSDTFLQSKDGYPPFPGSTYPPPPSGAYPPNKETYPPSGAYPPNKEAYPPSGAYTPNKEAYPPPNKEAYLPSAAYPPSSGAYPPSSGAYPPNKEAYPPYPSTTYPPYPDHQSTTSSDVHGEGLPYMEKGGGSKEKGGSKKEKEKGHGSHAPYGQPPPAGYQYPPAPHGYPPTPQGYPPAPQGYPPAPHGYPPAPQGYPPQGYAPAPHGYPPAPPPAPHGYPPGPQGYPPYGYPSSNPHAVAAPYGYPSSGHGSHSGHHPDKHGHGSGHGAAAGAYVGHSSSSSKPSKKHKEPKHDKHKKQKSFKGLKFKKFKF